MFGGTMLITMYDENNDPVHTQLDEADWMIPT